MSFAIWLSGVLCFCELFTAVFRNDFYIDMDDCLMYVLRELIETVEQNTHLKKQVSDLTAQTQQQVRLKQSMHLINMVNI